MKRMFLLFSHTLTEAQMQNAQETFGLLEFCRLPEDLQALWSSVDPRGELPIADLDRIVDFLLLESDPGDIVLVQGDFGAVYYVADACLETNRIPVYATTYRQCVETRHPDGSVSVTHTFSHIQFRPYRRYRND